ncbi:MAG: hypothetical protein H0U69_14375 [Trueperaceae bacterium]|nr:hypothetical protein [Trueperaceae bacterium]
MPKADARSHDPWLSRFDPLARILVADDFDDGINGWSTLIGNYEGDLGTMLPGYRDLRPAMLSNLTMWDTGSAGSMDGTYALKLATRPRSGHTAVNIKRVTWRHVGLVQLECYLAYKPEARDLALGELDVRAFGLLFDIQDDEARWMPHLRFLNALEGRPAAGSATQQASLETPEGRWQYKRETEPIASIGGSGKTVSHFHLSPNGWLDVPGGSQVLPYNEIATKVNWSYLRVVIDTRLRSFVEFQCNDRVFDGSALGVIRLPPMPNLRSMLNVAFFVQTDVDKRAFLLLDSVVLSTDG